MEEGLRDEKSPQRHAHSPPAADWCNGRDPCRSKHVRKKIPRALSKGRAAVTL
jgi:hypothetical protein